MRSYGQYCGLARALDIAGGRWTLLIVRELLIRQPCRYTDLAYGLPGIASNLLVDRLRQLEQYGVLYREDAPPPIATTVYRLTSRGEELRPVVHALERWGRPLLDELADDAEFRSHWLALPLEANLRDDAHDQPAAIIEVRTGDRPVVIQTADGGVRVRSGAARQPDAVITGGPDVVLGLLAGAIDLATAQRRGLHFSGSQAALGRIRPNVAKAG